jgi:NAD-dependent deacetylase
MHGELMSALCLACGARARWTGPMRAEDSCPACAPTDELQPDVVWFGEVPHHMESIADALSGCEQFVSIGASGQVWPAAGFAQAAHSQGVRTLELNLETGAVSHAFEETRLGRASELVSAWVAEIVGA